MKKLLISQKKLLRAYSSDDVNNMNGGDAWIHHMWSGDFMYLREGLVDDPKDYDFEAPQEGTPINSDAYVIPTNAKHPGTAMLFIDYLLRPENADEEHRLPATTRCRCATRSRPSRTWPRRSRRATST